MMIAVAILLPWLALLLRGHIFQALLCGVLQLTVLGWIPAAFGAVQLVRDLWSRGVVKARGHTRAQRDDAG